MNGNLRTVHLPGVNTVGELRSRLDPFSDDCPLTPQLFIEYHCDEDGGQLVLWFGPTPWGEKS